MFDQCWANVVDGGPTLAKHWVDVSWWLGQWWFIIWGQNESRLLRHILRDCGLGVVKVNRLTAAMASANTIRYSNIGPVSDQRCR